jgi:MGT family glycosyltransferase
VATALFFGLPAQGHTNPTLPLVSELVRRGEHILYYSTEEYRAAIEATGAEFRAYGDVFLPDIAYYVEDIVAIVRYLMQVSQQIVDPMLSEIQDSQPDYILYDSLAIWGQYCAQLLRLPAICSSSVFPCSWRLVMSVPLPELRGLFSMNEYWKIIAIGRHMHKKYGVKKLDFMGYLSNASQMTLVYTSRYFQPFAQACDETFKFVGPSLQPRPHTPPFPFEALHPLPLLYISLGTIYHQRNEFYRCCFQAFGDSPYQVVLSVGEQTAIEQLGPIPQNFIVRHSVPQLEILQRASLFITHAGMNSTSEALYYGVPLLAIPQAVDQPYVARRIAQLGAGISLSPKHATASRLRRLTETILADASYAQASANIGESFRQAGGFLAAVEEIQRFKQKYSIDQAIATPLRQPEECTHPLLGN